MKYFDTVFDSLYSAESYAQGLANDTGLATGVYRRPLRTDYVVVVGWNAANEAEAVLGGTRFVPA